MCSPIDENWRNGAHEYRSVIVSSAHRITTFAVISLALTRQQQDMGFLGTITSAWKNKSVEPVFFLYALCQGCYVIVAKNLYIDKVYVVYYSVQHYFATTLGLQMFRVQFQVQDKRRIKTTRYFSHDRKTLPM